MAGSLEHLQANKTVLLTTFKRDGTPVSTPVSIAFVDGRAFFRSYDKAGKAKRLRRNSLAELAPATLRGKPLGPAMRVKATLLTGHEARLAARALARGHRFLQGVLVPLGHRLMRYKTMHYELHPLEMARRLTGHHTIREYWPE